MKAIGTTIIALFFIVSLAYSQDTLYVYKAGEVVYKSVVSSIDSVTFYKNYSTPTIPETVTDIDGNVYHTVTIGTQTWMKESLRTTTLNDGTTMTELTDATQWWQKSVSLTTNGYCSYGNNNNNAITYGRLYNWNAVHSGKTCPKKWHVSTKIEWETLGNYLIRNGYNYDNTTAENKIGQSVAASQYWTYWSVVGTVGNTQTNKSGFNAFPSGYRDDNGAFQALGTHAFFWCMPDDSAGKYGSYYALSYKSSDLFTQSGPQGYSGYSIRCVKD